MWNHTPSSFCFWLISLIIMSSSSSVQYLVSELPSCLPFESRITLHWMCRILFTRLPSDGYFGCSHFLAVVKTTSVNMGVQIFLWDPAFSSLGYIQPEVELLYHMVILFLIWVQYCIEVAFFFLDLAKGLPYLVVFSEKELLVLFLFSVFLFLFSLSSICNLLFLPSVYIGFSLIFSSLLGLKIRLLIWDHLFFPPWLFLWHMDIPRSGIKSRLQLRPTPQLWQCGILNPLCHSGNSEVFFLI